MQTKTYNIIGVVLGVVVAALIAVAGFMLVQPGAQEAAPQPAATAEVTQEPDYIIVEGELPKQSRLSNVIVELDQDEPTMTATLTPKG